MEYMCNNLKIPLSVGCFVYWAGSKVIQGNQWPKYGNLVNNVTHKNKNKIIASWST